MTGIRLLLMGLVWGWIRVNLTAFANVPLWLSWILLARGHFAGARLCSTLALILSLETLQLVVQPMLYDEGATVKGFLVAPHLGFFCWIGSMLAIWIVSRRFVEEHEKLTDGLT